MLLGIDVGGTFTDAVIIDGANVAAQAKAPTDHARVLNGVLAALDRVLFEGAAPQLERAVISSTIVTNALTENKIDPVLLAVMTGPGMNVEGKFPVRPCYIGGYTDHRGKIIAAPQLEALRQIRVPVGRPCAVSGKFSVREPRNERLLRQELERLGAGKVFLGSELSGELNFIRRTNSAYFAAAVYEIFVDFCREVRQALAARQISAPVHILKADGGTLPLEAALEQPVEAVFPGPAAAVLGVEALAPPEVNAISLDIGGTTTDIAFWERGLPLMAKKGAVINGYPTAVRSFHMRSIGIGGDSKITCADGVFRVGPEREGPAAAVGGRAATLGDALITAGYVSFGDAQKARSAIAALGGRPQETAETIVAAAVGKITAAIEEMLAAWAVQPVYTVNDVIRGTEFAPQQLTGVGGGSPGLAQAVGRALGLPAVLPTGGMVANAIGAAVARPTISAGLRADTTEGYYLIPESGQRQPLPPGFNRKKAEELLDTWLRARAEKWGLPAQGTELTACEHFRTVHGYYSAGDIYNLRMQLQPGIMHKVCGREVEL